MATDLIIVGAGPCGLVSALLAKQAGLSCVVLERRAQGQFFGHAHYLNQYSLRILAAAGVDVGGLAAKATPVDSGLQMAYCTTFEQVFAKVSCFDDPLFGEVWEHADRYGTCLNVRFADLMVALLAACERQRVAIIWECAFDSLAPLQQCSSSHVSVSSVFPPAATTTTTTTTTTSSSSSSSSSSSYHVAGRQHGQLRFFCADWVLACDGARSSVAASLGVKKTEQKVWQHFLSVELRADLTPFLPSPSILVWIYHPQLQACMVVHDVSDYQVLQIPVAPGVTEKDLCLDRLRQTVHTLCGVSDLDALALSFGEVKAWSMQTFVLSSLVHNNVVFLGDSGHAMTPAGGLGLNTAFADAANLIWKIVHTGQTSSTAWLSSYESERKSLAKQNVQASIDNYQDFLSVPRCFGYDLLGPRAQKMLNAAVLPSVQHDASERVSTRGWVSWLPQVGVLAQRSLHGNRFLREYLAQATASHLRHFRGLDQHLGFCYQSQLVDRPLPGLGDYTLDYDVVCPGRMMPAVEVRVHACAEILFVHELLQYPKWCLLSQVREDCSSFLPDFLSGLVDCYYYGADYAWIDDSPKWHSADRLLIRPDGVVAFLGDTVGLQAFLAKLSAYVRGHGGGDGDGLHSRPQQD